VTSIRQRLREEVRDVLQAWNVLDDEVALAHLILQSVKPHVYRLRRFGSDGFGGETNGTYIRHSLSQYNGVGG
jgi:hypothetical protein